MDQERLNFHPNQLLIGPSLYVPGPALFLVDPRRMEIERSMSLLQLMDGEGLMPSAEEEIKRRNAIDKLSKIVMEWSKRVAYQRRLPGSSIRDVSAIVLIYGSYGLGVHNDESDIDALCVGPCFATMAEDFFIVLRNMLASRPEVSDILCVKDARIPLMRFKFDGIPFDLPYAKLNAISIPENKDLLNPSLLTNIDEISWRSLSGVLANSRIIQLVPNLGVYQSLLRCIKFWARRRGIDGNALGFLGGIHWAVLAALICQRQPNVHLGALVSIFFHTFAFWPWPTPVILEDMPQNNISIQTSLMPIQLPSSPNDYCYSNITRSTFNRIRKEFLHGHTLTKDFLRPDFDWKLLFEPFSYAKNYSRFLKIRLSSPNKDELGDWVGWVKSRILSLILMLEELQGFCDPNPTEYIDTDLLEPNIVLFWGLNPARSNNIDADSIKEAFSKNIFTGYEGPTGSIELKVAKASEFPKTKTSSGSKGTRACWRIVDGNQQRTALYSKHIPGYFVGYLVHDGNAVFSNVAS
ncbi:hypothetical protein BUALT_Bualt14G0129200 [Buddleja alternifolia]|uniref:polynucleotide adenylyltransferase n=1 Tax=Buddleja alternifolia TaxID=168488 RepID=A0AAV6WKD1_9LAMI|nr:hypothetical protein BUALT_Bualt14G0129200 [Buddleja alternifolia]